MNQPVLLGSLRTTTPDMKKQLKHRKQFDAQVKQPPHEVPFGLPYISQINLVEITKQRRHFDPQTVVSQRLNITRSRSPRPIQTYNLKQNLVPKKESESTPKKSGRQTHQFQICSFLNLQNNPCCNCNSTSEKTLKFSKLNHNQYHESSLLTKIKSPNNKENESYSVYSQVTARTPKPARISTKIDFSPISNNNQIYNNNDLNSFKMGFVESQDQGNFLLVSARGGTYFKNSK